MSLAVLIQLAGGGVAVAQCDSAKSEVACAEKSYCRWVVDPDWAVNGACWVKQGVLYIEDKYKVCW